MPMKILSPNTTYESYLSVFTASDYIRTRVFKAMIPVEASDCGFYISKFRFFLSLAFYWLISKVGFVLLGIPLECYLTILEFLNWSFANQKRSRYQRGSFWNGYPGTSRLSAVFTLKRVVNQSLGSYKRISRFFYMRISCDQIRTCTTCTERIKFRIKNFRSQIISFHHLVLSQL